MLAAPGLKVGRHKLKGYLTKSVDSKITFHINMLSRSKTSITLDNYPESEIVSKFPRSASIEVQVDKEILGSQGRARFIQEIN